MYILQEMQDFILNAKSNDLLIKSFIFKDNSSTIDCTLSALILNFTIFAIVLPEAMRK